MIPLLAVTCIHVVFFLVDPTASVGTQRLHCGLDRGQPSYGLLEGGSRDVCIGPKGHFLYSNVLGCPGNPVSIHSPEMSTCGATGTS